jgi:uncharacterized protein (TIGR00304 family)
MTSENGKFKPIYAGILLLLSGFIILIILAIEGLVRMGIFLFFPFVISSSPFAMIPFILIFSGIILSFISFPGNINDKYDMENNIDTEPENKKENSKSQFAGLVMIGPIPIIFGNNKKMIYISLAVAILIILIYILFIFHLL